MGIDAANALDEQPGDQHGLLGVVSDTAGRQARGDALAPSGVDETGDGAVVLVDLARGHRLGGHAEGVAQGQAGEGREGMVVRVARVAHWVLPKRMCRRNRSGASRLSTLSTNSPAWVRETRRECRNGVPGS